MALKVNRLGPPGGATFKGLLGVLSERAEPNTEWSIYSGTKNLSMISATD